MIKALSIAALTYIASAINLKVDQASEQTFQLGAALNIPVVISVGQADFEQVVHVNTT